MPWVILHPNGVSEDVILPKGFVSDGASAPQISYSICPPMGGAHGESSVLYDYLYSLDCEYECTRKEADDIFFFAMIGDGVSPHTASLIYSGVRLGGKSSFRKCFSIERVTEETTERKVYEDYLKTTTGGVRRGGDH